MTTWEKLIEAFFGAPAGAETVVYMRKHKTPAKHWEAKVKYDVWGSPYVTDVVDIVLRPGGKTTDTWLYGTEWRHKSGPPVTFGEKPSSPFDQEPSMIDHVKSGS